MASDASVADTVVIGHSHRSKVVHTVSYGRPECLPLCFEFLDPGALPLVLYSHQQLLDKISELKENALYVEPISAEVDTRRKSRSNKGGTSKSSQPSGSAQPSTSRRPSDPESSDKGVIYPDPIEPSPLSTVVDVHSEMYNLPSFQFLNQLLEYLYSQHGLLLRPVSTNHFTCC